MDRPERRERPIHHGGLGRNLAGERQRRIAVCGALAELEFAGAAGDDMSMVSFSILPQARFAMSVAYAVRGDRESGTLVQATTGIRMQIMAHGAGGVAGLGGARRNNYAAENIFELRDKWPGEVKKFVIDPLTKVTGHNPIVPGAVEAYRRLSGIKADPAITAQVQAIVDRFDSRSPADRAAAMKELGQLGNAGVLALARTDMAALTPEQSGKVSAFLAGQDHGAAYAGRSDRLLLIDLLEMDDPTVRAAAAKELGVSAETSAESLREKMATTEPAN
jgi:hypothetical protein